MSSILSSQNLVIATAMVVSSTALFLAFSKNERLFLHSDHKSLRSCLSSGDRRSERKKKKKVRFAEDVKEPRGDGEKYRREHAAMAVRRNSCRNEIPANRAALYNGILKGRSQRMECSV